MKSSRLGVGSLIRGRAFRGPQDGKRRPAPSFFKHYPAKGSITFYESIFLRHNGHDTTSEYIRSFQDGEQKGFNFLFREFYAALTWFSFRITDNRSVAEEIASTTLLKLWEKHSRFDNITSVKSFLYITARNSSISWLRQHKTGSKKLKELALLSENTEKTVLSEILEAEFYRSIFRAIDSLPAQCKKICRMLFIEGKDSGEIAQELGLSLSTIRNQKARAIQLLRRRLILPVILATSLILMF